MSDKAGLRFDKFLWSVRLFKTRSMATAACKNGRIILNGLSIKPSKATEVNEIFTLRRPPALLTFKIISLPPTRVSAKLVSQYIEDITPESERDKLAIRLKTQDGHRLRGTGRPTKKDRRTLDDLHSNDF